jgi:hypothetical protein
MNAIAVGDFSKDPEWEGGFFKMVVKGPEVSSEQRRRQLQNWILSKAFQDLARGVRAMLEEAYLYVGVVEMSRDPNNLCTTWLGMEAKLKVLRKKAGELNFPQLMEAVNKVLSAPLNFEKEFVSLQRVRNCLEHRHGIVSDKDADPGAEELRLSLPRMKLFVERGDKEVEIREPHFFVEKEEQIGFRTEIRERVFKVGEFIRFDAEEFDEIAFGCWAFASDLASKLPDVNATTAKP